MVIFVNDYFKSQYTLYIMHVVRTQTDQFMHLNKYLDRRDICVSLLHIFVCVRLLSG